MTTLPDWSTVLGLTAAALTTGAFVPQAILTVRTRSVAGLSIPMYTLFTLGVALWLAYGVLLGSWPIILANAITLVLALTILSVALHCLWRSRGPTHAVGATPYPESASALTAAPSDQDPQP